ncbi:MAG: cyclic nucleotide-binding domain-containing protein [Elusimicrobia bacterium]|nr:cyclic nucleotide-binding domain-containing protein [Elusimicrobiota bacterium]
MIEKIRNIQKFKVFPEDILEKLSRYVGTATFRDGDVIFRENDAGDCMYIIEKGEVEIRKKDKVLTLFRSGDVFGEMAIFEDERRSADAISRTGDTTLLKLNNKDFRKFIFEYPQYGIKFLYENMQEMSRRLRRTSEYLITIFETGKLVGGDYGLSQMTEKILNRLLEDIADVTGGMIILLNPFTDFYDVAAEKNVSLYDADRIVELIKNTPEGNISGKEKNGVMLAVPMKDENKKLGYIVLEKKGSPAPFSVEQEIILSSVGNQVGLGIVKAYNKKEEEARQRLEQSRMKGY